MRTAYSFNLSDYLSADLPKLPIRIEACAHATLRFAAEELARHLATVGLATSIVEGADHALDTAGNVDAESMAGTESAAGAAGVAGGYGNGILLRVAAVGRDTEGGLDRAGNRDEYSITALPGRAVITGTNPQAVLFGVYRFLEAHTGIAWPTPAGSIAAAGAPITHPVVGSRSYRASFPKRGIVLESAETLAYAQDVIYWSAKNGLNHLFFTMEMWQQYGHALRKELALRQLNLTLGGHNLDLFFPAEALFAEHPEMFALTGGGRRTVDQPCYSHAAGVGLIIANIVAYVEREIAEGTALDTLSLWPNDNKRTCQCAACLEAGFIATYIAFLGELRTACAARGLDIRIEHIAYNAQLEWRMLEEVSDTRGLDTLVACWGRDYQFPLPSSPSARDQRFRSIIDRWAEACGKSGTELTVFEYYSDYWMLSPLFPPLFHTIAADAAYYQGIGATGVMSLIVPYSKAVRIIRADIMERPLQTADAWREFNSEQAMMWPNLYMFAQTLWEGADTEEVLGRLSRLLYGEQADRGMEMQQKLSQALAGLTAYSTEFFKLRFTDAWLRMEGDDIIGWNPVIDNPAIPQSRIAECRRALAILDNGGAGTVDGGLAETAGIPYDLSAAGSHKANLEAYQRYVILKLQSLIAQSAGQLAYMSAKWNEAAMQWQNALLLEDKLMGWDREECLVWLEEARKHAGK